MTTSSEPCYSVKGSCFSLLYFNIKILQKSSGKNRAPLAPWNIIDALMVTETTILVSCFVCVTPQCLRGHPGPCFCTQGSRRISEPCRASVCQVPLWPALWVCGQQDSHCATATHFPKNPWPVTLVLINCCCYARKSNLGAISQGK